MRFRVRVLLQAPDIFSIEGEIDLAQAALGSSPNSKALVAEPEGLGILDESLPPNLNEHVFKGEIHVDALRADYMPIAFDWRGARTLRKGGVRCGRP
jgi:hypothetical protein